MPEILAQFAQAGIKIVPRIYLVDSLQDVLNHVEQGICDLGLVTYNEEALFRKFVPYQYSLDMDLLAQDELVVVMAKENYPADQESLALQDFLDQFCTMFSTMPVESAVQSALDTQVTRSNNADFHRAMIKKAGAYVLMPKRAYEYFFGDEEYAAMPLSNSKTSLLHAAIYRKNAGEWLLGFAAMIRAAMQQ